MHFSTKETPKFGEFLETQASDHKFQATSQAVGLPASLFTYDLDSFLVRPAAGDRTNQKYFAVTFGARVLFLSYNFDFSLAPKKTIYA